jgi:acyl-homoserine lactone acylase PvdQ
MPRWTRWLAVSVALLVGEPVARWALRPRPPAPTPEMLAHAARVEILRDRWGIPHVFGQTDADAAFGLAYAHAEDDWPMIQGVLAASRGRLGLLKPGQTALLNDGYAALIGVDAEVDRRWPELSPAFQQVVEAYAQGLDLYAAHHPDEVDARLLPITGKDVVRGFVHKLPLMLGVPDVLKALNDGSDRAVGDPVMPGSNAHAVAAWRSADGKTRLNVNSHQPWQGPVTWYEAQVHSEEGWDMAGGTFPGAPMILHGTSDRLGWALTVNTADRVDVYRLTTDDAHPDAYAYDGGWRPFESTRAWLPIETPWATLWVPKTFRRSVHGPVVDTDHGTFAVRTVGVDQGVAAAEQWFRMNKARDLDEWRAAMSRVAIPMFNAVYADASHVYYVYNARIPDRDPAFDYASVLPGDDPRALWTDALPLDRLPQVLDPASGFVQACNSSPWSATIGPENPVPADFPSTAGIEDRLTNRSRRTLELLADGAPIDRDAFLAMKWDRRLAADAPLRAILLDPLRAWTPGPEESADVRQARDALVAWDGSFDEDGVGAAIAVLAWRKLDPMGYEPLPGYDPRAALRTAAEWLREHRGRIDVPLGEIQRLRHGDVDLPLGGGPDVLNAVYAHFDGDVLVGDQGDSLVMEVEYDATGARAWSVHQYGASNRPDSPHYSDQAPLFVKRELVPLFRTRADLDRFAEARYHPGEDWSPAPPSSPEERRAEAEAVWAERPPDAP